MFVCAGRMIIFGLFSSSVRKDFGGQIPRVQFELFMHVTQKQIKPGRELKLMLFSVCVFSVSVFSVWVKI